jgi:hypothetical protein
MTTEEAFEKKLLISTINRFAVSVSTSDLFDILLKLSLGVKQLFAGVQTKPLTRFIEV